MSNSLNRFTITTDDRQKTWINRTSNQHNLSIREFFRRLVDAALIAKWDPSQELDVASTVTAPSKQVDVGELEPREKFVVWLREKYDVGLACEKAGVTEEQVVEWCGEDVAYHRRVLNARNLYLAETEASLKEVGEGRQSGNSQALSKFLEANHPSYGALRRRNFDTVMGDLIDSIAYHATAEFSLLEGGPAAAKRFLEKVVDDTRYYRSTLAD